MIYFLLAYIFTIIDICYDKVANPLRIFPQRILIRAHFIPEILQDMGNKDTETGFQSMYLALLNIIIPQSKSSRNTKNQN